MSLEGAIAANRFGLGARPGEIAASSVSPRAWLIRQLEAPADEPVPLDGGPPFESTGEVLAEFREYKREKRERKRQKRGDLGAAEIDPAVKQLSGDRMRRHLRELAARFALGFTTKRPFSERLVWFWSNHFTVSAAAKAAMPLLGAFEREAIRPNITGRFEDLVLAVTHHPAMLIYLNNNKSTGPDSAEGKFGGKGLNENLGRELMELHTLGVDGGYSQADVIALSKILTGWGLNKNSATGFRFHADRHEPGNIVLRGKTYAGGEEAGITAIRDLARDPATARHIAKKFATHFIADDPPADSVARLEKTFKKTGGDLKALAETVVDDPNAWATRATKVRTPMEYVTAAMRAVGWSGGRDRDQEQQVQQVMTAVRTMGEFPMAAPSPKGWPDEADAWTGPDALLNRIEWARELGSKLPRGFDAVGCAEAGLGPSLQDSTRTAMKACPNAGEAVALLLSSPEFQRR